MSDGVIDGRWLGSVYALLAVAVCILVFSWSNTSLSEAFLKTVFISIAFYIIGVVFGSVLSVVVKLRDKRDIGDQSEGRESEQGSE